MNEERQEWQDLTGAPGWARLKAHAEAEWSGPTFARLVESLADRPEDTTAMSKLRQAIAAKRAVEKLLAVPEEQIARLDRLKAAEQGRESGPRRGAL
jgi:hypothetical protein